MLKSVLSQTQRRSPLLQTLVLTQRPAYSFSSAAAAQQKAPGPIDRKLWKNALEVILIVLMMYLLGNL